jgi:hypothetical protein
MKNGYATLLPALLFIYLPTGKIMGRFGRQPENAGRATGIEK